MSILGHLAEFAGSHPWDAQLIEECRDRVALKCSQVNISVYKRHHAQGRLEFAAKEAVCEVFNETFPDALRPLVITRTWPWANCIIRKTADGGRRATIEFSISAETDELTGGPSIEPVDIPVQAQPLNAAQKAIRGIFKRHVQAPPAQPAPKVTAAAQAAPQKPAAKTPQMQAAPKAQIKVGTAPVPPKPPVRKP